MKRGFALILTLALALLASCELMVPGPTERPSIGLPAEPTEAATPAPLPTVGLTPPAFVPAEYDPRYDDDPNFIFSFVSNMCATEDTFYFAYSDTKIGQMYHETVCFLDKASGYVGPLCGKPECTHDNKDCNAYIKGHSYGLSIYDGRLYWMEVSSKPSTALDDPNPWPVGVYSTALDGTDRRLVRKLDRELIQSGAIDGVFHRGWFYLAGDYQTVVDGEASNNVYVAAWPLDSDEPPTVIIDMPVGPVYFDYSVQGYGDGIYIFVHSEYDRTLTIARWSPETLTLETFYKGAYPNEGGKFFTVREDGVYFIGSIIAGDGSETGFGKFRFALYRYDFASGKFEENADFETPYTRYGISHSWLISEDLLVMAGSPGDGELTVMALDFEGNVLLDQTYRLEIDFSVVLAYYCGRDETNLYLFHPKFRGPEVLIAVALDGSGARILWDSDVGPH